MYKISMSSKRITPDQVHKDNSNIWRYSPELQAALRKENFSKAYPEAYLHYKDAVGEWEPVSPYPDVDFQMDLEKFKDTLEDMDRTIFSYMLVGMRQDEIAEATGILQPGISKRLKKLRELFKQFYYD